MPTAFLDTFAEVSAGVYENAKAHGFHEQGSESENVPTKLMLVVSELAEAMEAHRKNLQSDKIPEFTGIEEELADAVIRIMDLAVMENLRLGEAILAKETYNRTRSYLHGNKRY